MWGPLLSESQLNRLQNLHKWGVRITACLRKYDHVTYHRHQLNWLSVSSMIRYRSLCVMHGIYHHNNVSFDLPIIFGSTHAYRTRWSERLIQQAYCRLSATKTSFQHLVSRWWNELSDDLVASPTFLSSAYDYFFNYRRLIVLCCCIYVVRLYCIYIYIWLFVYVCSCIYYVFNVCICMCVLYALVWKNGFAEYWS